MNKSQRLLNLIEVSNPVATALQQLKKYITKQDSEVGRISVTVNGQMRRDFEKLIKSIPILDKNLNNIDSTSINTIFVFNVV